jgi:hypothetical protein
VRRPAVKEDVETGGNGHEHAMSGNGHLEKDEVDEDDGIVLAIVTGKKGERCILVALDGLTLKVEVYGMGPHGSFIEKKGMY